jgi:hypothetical protein
MSVAAVQSQVVSPLDMANDTNVILVDPLVSKDKKTKKSSTMPNVPMPSAAPYTKYPKDDVTFEPTLSVPPNVSPNMTLVPSPSPSNPEMQETNEPTLAVVTSPAPTELPLATETSTPTVPTSSTETNDPTAAPSRLNKVVVSSDGPSSSAPSATPLSRTTNMPTVTVPAATTVPPSMTTTTTTTQSPTVTAKVRVALPKLAFDLETASPWSSSTSASDDDLEKALGTALGDFLSDFIESSGPSYANGFDRVNVQQTTLVTSSSDSTATYSLAQGEALYEAEVANVPTESDLATLLSTYFGFRGDDALVEQWSSTAATINYPRILNITAVYVNDERLASLQEDDHNVSPVATVDENAPAATDTINSRNSSSNNSEVFNRYVIAGIVVGGVVLLLGLAFLVRTVHNARRGNGGANMDHDRRPVVVIDSLDDDEEDPKNVTGPTVYDDGAVAGSGLADVDSDDDGIPLVGSGVGLAGRHGASYDEDRVGALPHQPTDLDTSSDAGEVLVRASNAPLKYPDHDTALLRIHAANDDDDDDDDHSRDGEYTSDGDIISVTESLLMKQQEYTGQGPLFNVKSLPLPATMNQMPRASPAAGLEDSERSSASVPEEPNAATTTTTTTTAPQSSGRAAAAAPPTTAFQYDASRLDQVISSAKGQQQQQQQQQDTTK